MDVDPVAKEHEFSEENIEQCRHQNIYLPLSVSGAKVTTAFGLTLGQPKYLCCYLRRHHTRIDLRASELMPR